MKLPNKARQRENEFLATVFDLLRRYQKGDIPETSVTVGQLDAKLTWLCDRIREARNVSLPPAEKRAIQDGSPIEMSK